MTCPRSQSAALTMFSSDTIGYETDADAHPSGTHAATHQCTALVSYLNVDHCSL